jgi:dTDP-glucose pyrophosphorylase
MQWGEVTGVILAAGRGSRMTELGLEYPKPLLPIGNQPLMVAHLHAMRALGIRRVIVVIGHMGSMVVNRLSALALEGVAVEYVEQERPLGIAHAVGQLERLIDGPLLLFLGDIFFSAPNIGSMLELLPADGNGAVLAVREEPSIDAIRKNYTVQLTPDGVVRRVLEKPRVVTTNLKGCGMYLFGPSIFDAVRRTPRTAARDEYEITDSIQILIDSGAQVRIACVVDRDVNLTFPRDLLDCNLLQLAQSSQSNLIDPGAHVHQDARLSRCVVGEGARVDAPVDLNECVVLPGGRVERPGALHRVIITPTQQIQC